MPPAARRLLLTAAFAAPTLAAAQPPAKNPPEKPNGKVESEVKPVLEVDKYGFPLVKPKKPAAKAPSSPKSAPSRFKPAPIDLDDDEQVSDELKRLVKALKKGKTLERVQAARTLAAMGASAAPAARAMCDVIGSAHEAVARETLAALERVQPQLHAPVSTIVLDASFANRAAAAKRLAGLGAEGLPATGLLVDRLAAGYAARTAETALRLDPYLAELYEALLAVAAEDAQAVAFFKGWAGPGFQGRYQRWMGLNYLTRYAGVDPDRRTEVAPFVMAGIADAYVQNYCVQKAGDYGAVCKRAYPVIVALKQSPDKTTREVATLAAGKIEAAVDE